MNLDYSMFWMKAILSYVMLIALWLIFFPNQEAFAVDLANHLPPLLFFCLGISLTGLLDSLLDSLKKRRSHDCSETRTPTPKVKNNV